MPLCQRSKWQGHARESEVQASKMLETFSEGPIFCYQQQVGVYKESSRQVFIRVALILIDVYRVLLTF
jgi:hypothetical protein